MKKSRIVFGICFAVFIPTLIWWLIHPSQVAEQPLSIPRQSSAATNAIIPQKQQENLETRRQVVAAIESALNAPITFYGKVVDQNGSPVPFARAAYGLLDKFNESGSNGHVDADANGFFTIQGVRGAAIGVNVSKSGYYQIHKVSDQYFSYGSGGDSMSKPPPPRDNPAVFVLQKMGEPVSLIFVSSRQVDVPRAGQSVSINLAGEQAVEGNLQMSSWIGDSNQRPFDWRYQLSIPGGGLIERKAQFDFEAPNANYQSTVEINMAADAEQWNNRLTKEYFAKLGDGRFARFSVRFYPGNRNFVVLESYLNPTPGSRNLEFDPAKVVKLP